MTLVPQTSQYPSITNYRLQFAKKLENREIFNGTIEILGASFFANERTIFGTVSDEYLSKEIQWYLSQSLNVYDLKDTPEIWKKVSSPAGEINSNYGYLLFNSDNYSQFKEITKTLLDDKNSRRAVAIYTRPSMHRDYNEDGMSDFICTNAVHYEIRNNQLNVIVQMRSNDAIFGYKNDYAWQKYIQNKLLLELLPTYPQLEIGEIIWQVASFHIYERHFYLVDHFDRTGETTVSPAKYKGKYDVGVYGPK